MWDYLLLFLVRARRRTSSQSAQLLPLLVPSAEAKVFTDFTPVHSTWSAAAPTPGACLEAASIVNNGGRAPEPVVHEYGLSA
jgi:hypothetical protein